jgi:hypothetical protein
MNTMDLAKHLRETQRARLNPAREILTGDVSRLIKKGIEQYNRENIQDARESYRNAVKLDRRAARIVFLSLYSQESQVTLADEVQRIERLCVVPPPGRISAAEKPNMKERSDVEKFLRRYGSQINTERLKTFQLWLLWSYVEEKDDKKADELFAQFIAETNLKALSADESYTLAYLMLKAHGDLMVPPKSLSQIQILLSNAFKEFKIELAESAFRELLSESYKDRTPPIWYISMLSSLSQFQLQSFWIPFRLGMYLDTRNHSQKELEFALILLDRAQSNLSKAGVEEDRRLLAWIDYGRAISYMNLSYYRSPQDKIRLLNQASEVLTRLKNRVEAKKGWPELDSIYFYVANVSLLSGNIKGAKAEVFSGLDQFPESQDLKLLRWFLVLAEGQADNALKLVRNHLQTMTKKDPAYKTWYTYSIMLQLLIGEGDFITEARRYLDASYDEQDYIRMMLYWALSKRQRESEAKILLADRWPSIKSADWPARLEQGDKKVWPEMLLAYYSGKIDREEVYGPLENRTAFEKSKLTMLGTSFLGFQCDYFYDAMHQEVSNNPSDRQMRALGSLEKVVASQQFSYFEFHAARYLINRLQSQVSEGAP